MEKQKIYMVQLAWTSEDGEGIETELFDTKEKAIERFNRIIRDEKTLECCWSKDAFDKKGNLDTEKYKPDTNIDNLNAVELYWDLRCIDNYYLHDSLELQIKEVK